MWDGKIKPGFEMLVNNFSAGIWGMILAHLRLRSSPAPFVAGVHRPRSATSSDFLVDHNLLPLTSILIEPAKVLFLNNAINHGVLTPLGIQEAVETGPVDPVPARGQPRPGPRPAAGLHRSSARALAKATAPGALIIQFFGGIHEIYFPYVLMKPKLILAMILGGMTGVAINLLFDSGLRAPAAPGLDHRGVAADAGVQPRRRDAVGRRRPRRVSRSRSRRSC